MRLSIITSLYFMDFIKSLISPQTKATESKSSLKRDTIIASRALDKAQKLSKKLSKDGRASSSATTTSRKTVTRANIVNKLTAAQLSRFKCKKAQLAYRTYVEMLEKVRTSKRPSASTLERRRVDDTVMKAKHIAKVIEACVSDKAGGLKAKATQAKSRVKAAKTHKVSPGRKRLATFLGISPDGTDKEFVKSVNTRKRQTLLRLHPDKNLGNIEKAASDFKLWSESFETAKDHYNSNKSPEKQIRFGNTRPNKRFHRGCGFGNCRKLKLV